MKPLAILLYAAAAVLLVLALILLTQVFAARQMVGNAVFPYRILLGGSGPLIDQLEAAIVSGVRWIFVFLTLAAAVGGGLFFALARLLRRLDRQKERIAELEAQLAAKRLKEEAGSVSSGNL